MDDDSRVADRGLDALPDYAKSSGDADDAVTVSISTTPGEWLVNTVDSVVVPMSMAEVVDALQKKQLNLRSLVWRAGMQEWAPVDRVPQLRLAARLDARDSTASSPLAVTDATTNAGGPRSAAKTIPPQRRSTPGPLALPSRRSTLPFGLASGGARPSSPLAASSPRASSSPFAAPRPAIPPAEGEDQDVLAVYDRPLPTVSFDLAPVDPERSASRTSAGTPQTLAPTTSDAPATLPRSADLSVVAASHFRQSQRSSKHWIVISSVASAAAASLLTFALAGRGPKPHAVAPAPEVTAAPPAAAAPPMASSAAPAVEVVPVAVSQPSAAPSTSPPQVEPAPKLQARRAKARSTPSPQPAAPPPEAESTSSPAAEPNPYDIKSEDEPPKAKPSVSHGSGLGDESGPSEPPPATDPSKTPGF